MNVPVLLRVKDIEIKSTGILTLPAEFQDLSYKIISNPVMHFELDLNNLSENNIYLLRVNGGAYFKLKFGKEAETSILELIKGGNTVQLVIGCSGDEPSYRELCQKYNHRLNNGNFYLTGADVKALKENIVSQALLYNLRLKNQNGTSVTNIGEHMIRQVNLTSETNRGKSTKVLFSQSNSVLSGFIVDNGSISTKWKRCNISRGGRYVKVPDFTQVIDKVNMKTLRAGNYDLNDLKSFLTEFGVEFRSNHMSRDKLEIILECFILAYQNKVCYCSTDKLITFMDLFGYKDYGTDVTTKFQSFLGLKNVLELDLDTLGNKLDEELDNYLRYFDILEYLGNGDKYTLLTEHINSMH